MCTECHEPARPGEMTSLLGRRGFLRGSAVAAVAAGAPVAGVALAGPAAAHAPSGQGRRRVPVDRISIQLYTVRDILTADPEGTIATLASIGYTRVETAGTAGLTAAAFRALLDKYGIRATSSHAGIPQPFDAATWQATLATARTLGVRNVVHPYFGTDANGPIRSAAVYAAFARDLNTAAAAAHQAGFGFGYHNHHNEFLRQDDGRTGYQVLTDTADRRLVHLELDLYWAWRGAADPVDVMHRNRRRVKQFHVKDMAVSSAFTDPGTGLIDFSRIFAAATDDAAIAEYIVERDDAGTGTRTPAQALDTARVGFEFLRTIRF